jgi:hypothetical protein
MVSSNGSNHSNAPLVSFMLTWPCLSIEQGAATSVAELAGELLLEGGVKAGIVVRGLACDSPHDASISISISIGIGIGASNSGLGKRGIGVALLCEWLLGAGVAVHHLRQRGIALGAEQAGEPTEPASRSPGCPISSAMPEPKR